jgi:hypothetical protein
MADNEVNIVISATDNASKTLAAIGKILEAGIGTVKDLTGGYIEYGDEVRKLSNFVGTNSEETSRMIQLADDAFVSYESLRMASKNLADEGIAPTTANMAKLSDEYLKLAPGVERSQFLLDKFGRAGIEMAAIMQLGGSKIREMSANISQSLIIDDQKAASILKTKQRLDEFNDQLEGMKFDMAQGLLNIFDQMPKPLQDAALAMGSFLSPTNINSLIQFGILLKGLNFGALASGAWSMAAGFFAAIAPIAAVLGAAYALVKLFEMNEFKQVIALLTGGVVGLLSGGNKVAQADATARTYQALGGGSPAGNETGNFIRGTLDNLRPLATAGASGGGGTAFQFNYMPTLSTASKMEAQANLAPVIAEILRQQGGR